MVHKIMILLLLVVMNAPVLSSSSPQQSIVPLNNNGISGRFLKGGLHVSGPEVSVTIVRFGFEGAVEQVLTFLPSSVALAFDVYSKLEQKWVERAKKQGNSIFLCVSPFKFVAGNAFGPASLNLYTQESDIQEWHKNVGPSLKGFLIDRNVCQDTRVFAALASYVKKQNLLIFLSEPGQNTQMICSDNPGRCSVGDIVIEPSDVSELIENKLEATRLLAEKQGYANLIVFLSNPEMLTKLKNWMIALEVKKINFVPIEKNLTKENRYG